MFTSTPVSRVGGVSARWRGSSSTIHLHPTPKLHNYWVLAGSESKCLDIVSASLTLSQCESLGIGLHHDWPGACCTPLQIKVMLQDLSVYSWLDCEPDDLYKLTNYSLYEMQESLPHPMPDYLEYWRQNGPGFHSLSPVLSALGRFSFTARPMQV